MSRTATKAVIASCALWSICLLAYVGVLLMKRALGDLGCEDPVGSSNYGTASWSLWPLGTTCTYTAASIPGFGSVRAHSDGPSVMSAATSIVLLVWAVATGIAARALRRRATRADPA